MVLCACVNTAVHSAKIQESVLTVNYDYFGSCGKTAET